MFKTIVVIDDGLSSLKLVADALNFFRPDDLVVTVLVERDMDILKHIPERVDVFFVDYEMGAVTGPEVIRRLVERYPGVHIIGWSADLTPEKKEAFLEAGAQVVTEKLADSITKIAELVEAA